MTSMPFRLSQAENYQQGTIHIGLLMMKAVQFLTCTANRQFYHQKTEIDLGHMEGLHLYECEIVFEKDDTMNRVQFVSMLTYMQSHQCPSRIGPMDIHHKTEHLVMLQTFRHHKRCMQMHQSN